MNVNEVITNRALELARRRQGRLGYIHPIDHVNMHQSTNDTYPSACKVAMLMHLDKLEDALIKLQEALQEKERAFTGILKLGLPRAPGCIAHNSGHAVRRLCRGHSQRPVEDLQGARTHQGAQHRRHGHRHRFQCAPEIHLPGDRETQGAHRPCHQPLRDMVDATQNLDAIVEVSGLVKTCAVNLMKISEDLRLLSSGPSGGIGEVILPARQEGSSIMPGKVNPVMCEFATQISLVILAYDNTIAQAAALGNLELNQFFPLVSYLVLKSMSLLRLALIKFEDGLIKGLTLNREKIDANLNDSVAILTYLSPYIGHDAAARMYLIVKSDKRTLKQIILDEKVLTERRYDELVSPERIRMMGYKK